jgi:hypothetical protein
MRTNYGTALRRWLKNKQIKWIIDFGDLPVFKNATTYPCILILSNGPPRNTINATNVRTLDFPDLREYVKKHHIKIHQKGLDDMGWSLVDTGVQILIKKLFQIGIPLGEYIKDNIYRGVVTGLNKAFVIDEDIRNNLIKKDPRCLDLIKSFLEGKDVKRYQPTETTKYVIFTRRGIDIKKYPTIEQHLNKFKTQLMPKPRNWKGKKWPGRKPGSYKWYEIQDTIDYFLEFEKPKIIYPNICKRPEFTLDETNKYTNQKCFIIPLDDKYLLGILNSKLFYFLFKGVLPKLRGGFYEPSYVIFKNFPICNVNFSDKNSVAKHKKIITMVNRMLDLNRQLTIAKTETEKTIYKRQINITDQQIDHIVYKLYGLTEKEVNIVEEAKI